MSLEDKLYNKHWYALHTKSHHEKKVASLLEGKGVELFLPVRRLQRKWKDRKKMVDFPLFPGYIFVNIPLTEKKIVIQTPSVVKLVGTKEPEPLPSSQIISVQKFVEEEIEFDPYPYLIPGVEVEVCRGPLKGVRGVLEQRKGKHRLIVNIYMINNCIATEIDAEDVKKV